MLDGLLRRGVYNLGEQAVVLILDRELGVRDDGLRHELVSLTIVPCGPVLIQDVDVPVRSVRPDGLEALLLLDDSPPPLNPSFLGKGGAGFLEIHAFIPPHVTSPIRLKALSL